MHVKIGSEQEALAKLGEAIHIHLMIKKYTDEWREHYGTQRLRRLKYWEERRDTLIASVQVPDQEIDFNKVIVTIQ